MEEVSVVEDVEVVEEKIVVEEKKASKPKRAKGASNNEVAHRLSECMEIVASEIGVADELYVDTVDGVSLPASVSAIMRFVKSGGTVVLAGGDSSVWADLESVLTVKCAEEGIGDNGEKWYRKH